MNGEINIDSLSFAAPETQYFLEQPEDIGHKRKRNQKRLTIQSNFLQGSIEGDYSYRTLPASVLNIMRRYIPALILPDRNP